MYFTSFLPLNQWHHLAITYDGAILRGYLDGVLDLAVPMSFGPIIDTFRIGQTRNAYETFPGSIDEVRIYGVMLTESEVVRVMNGN
ncbi:MAG: LamG domain-containing protein [Patescibacteria group bacterium]